MTDETFKIRIEKTFKVLLQECSYLKNKSEKEIPTMPESYCHFHLTLALDNLSRILLKLEEQI